MSNKKTKINFRNKSFLKDIINGAAPPNGGIINGWDDLPKIDLGNEPESYSEIMDNHINALGNPNLEEIMLFIWSVAPDKLKKAMAQYKITINKKEDFEWLIRSDENGHLKSWFKTHGFDPVNLEDIICKIRLSQNELESANLNLNFGC